MTRTLWSGIGIGAAAIVAAVWMSGNTSGIEARTAGEAQDHAIKQELAAALGDAMNLKVKTGLLAELDTKLAVQFGALGRVVEGAPYSAAAEIESVQALEDGNRIVHREHFLVARDSLDAGVERPSLSRAALVVRAHRPCGAISNRSISNYWM